MTHAVFQQGAGGRKAIGYVTARLANHAFALPLSAVHEIFVLDRITSVPSAPDGVIGMLNLRGRIVTALDTRGLLGFPPADPPQTLAIGVERNGELFGLAVDAMGDVLTITEAPDQAPTNIDRRWREIVTGVIRSDDHLVLIVSVDRLFDGVGALVAA